jgi:hypothetical protein
MLNDMIRLVLSEYEEYYQRVHGLKTDFSGIAIPVADDVQFPWFVCRPEKFFAERVFEQLYSKQKYTRGSLDDILDMNFGRDGKQESYIIRLHGNWEADENLKNLSAIQITEKHIKTACLVERLILGDFLFWKFRKDLDIENITLCSNSRYRDGGVPSVEQKNTSVYVDYCFPEVARYHLRAREVVSC